MRLIDLDGLPKGRVEWEDIFDAPIIDAVEVVRCKDCKYNILGECAVTNMIHQDESFCSWGVEE